MKISERKKLQAEKKRRQRQGLGTRIVLGLVVVLLVFVSIKSFDLNKKRLENEERVNALKTELAAEEARSKEIDSYAEYVGTDEYIEQLAKDRLGLAHPNETLLKPAE